MVGIIVIYVRKMVGIMVINVWKNCHLSSGKMIICVRENVRNNGHLRPEEWFLINAINAFKDDMQIAVFQWIFNDFQWLPCFPICFQEIAKELPPYKRF